MSKKYDCMKIDFVEVFIAAAQSIFIVAMIYLILHLIIFL